MEFFKTTEFAQQAVVLAVRDFGTVEDVVEMVVATNKVAQPRDLFSLPRQVMLSLFRSARPGCRCATPSSLQIHHTHGLNAINADDCRDVLLFRRFVDVYDGQGRAAHGFTADVE